MILTRADIIEMLRDMPPRSRGRRALIAMLVKLTNAELALDVSMEKAAQEEIRSAAFPRSNVRKSDRDPIAHMQSFGRLL